MPADRTEYTPAALLAALRAAAAAGDAKAAAFLPTFESWASPRGLHVPFATSSVGRPNPLLAECVLPLLRA